MTYGYTTYKELTPEQKKWVEDRAKKDRENLDNYIYNWTNGVESIKDWYNNLPINQPSQINANQYVPSAYTNKAFNPKKLETKQKYDINANVIKPLTAEEQQKYNNYLIEQENKKTLNQAQQARQKAVNTALNDNLPPLPKVDPTSALQANFNPNSFEKINPDGTIQEAQQETNPLQSSAQINQYEIPQLNEFVKNNDRSALINSLARGINNFRNGFVENRYNSFNPSNFTDNKFKVGENKEQNKGVMGRVGEAVGTARRALDKPVVQGITNGLAMGLMSANPMIGLIAGLNSANNAGRSQIYSKALRDYGFDVQDSPLTMVNNEDFTTLTKPIIEQQKQEADIKKEQLKHNNNLILQQNELAIKQYEQKMKEIKDNNTREKVKNVLEMLVDPNLPAEKKDLAFRELYAETGINAYKDFEKYLKAVSEESMLDDLRL